jgi:hypothetical protein
MAALTAAFPLALNRFVPARRVDAAARVLLADIRFAEARSVATGHAIEIVPATNGYQVSLPGIPSADAISTRRWRSSTALILKSSDDSRELSCFRIYPDGSSTGARFRIRDGERVREVIVSELTSRARVEAKP